MASDPRASSHSRGRHRRRVAALWGVLAATLVVGAVLAWPAPAGTARTESADRFVDAAGVNIHLHYNNTVYWDDFPLIKSRLSELGVRHVRDGLVDTTWKPYYERHNALGEAGIKGVFITAPSQSTELWASYPARMHAAFEAYEAPNEYDKKSTDPNWAGTLRETLSRLHTLKEDARAAPFPIYGPSLTSAAAYDALGDVSALYDFTNLHNYFAGRHPGSRGWGNNGYGSITWNLDISSRYAGGKPTVTTETGYQTDVSLADGVPQEVAGRYMPRVLLEQFLAGITRTYLYELADFRNSGAYGLLHADGSPKPAYTAVKGLLNLLADPGPPITPEPLDYAVRGGSSDLRHVAFQKRDGSYAIALWLSLPSYDPISRKSLAIAGQNVVLALPRAMQHVRTHRWTADGTVAVAAASATITTIPVTVSDLLTVIELTPPAP